MFKNPIKQAKFFKIMTLIVLKAFIGTMILPIPVLQAVQWTLPIPGHMVSLSLPANPPVLKGLKVYSDNPFRFDFILDKGDSVETPLMASLQNSELKKEANRLIKYFLASITISEKDLWVNLSPYEKNRIIPPSFGRTEMGRDLLAEDYILKQITSSLIYPEGQVGKKFWKRVYSQAVKKYGTTDVPVNTINKVWIMPEKAIVYENAKNGTAYVIESKLKVMLEEDYLALSKHSEILPPTRGHAPKHAAKQESVEYESTPGKSPHASNRDINALGSQIVREIVIPQLTTEINKNKNFARLRQVYSSLILATWYKQKIKDSILDKVYADKNKVAGVEYLSTVIPVKEKIKFKNDIEGLYKEYLKAFKKGVYNYIKEEIDPVTQEVIPRKYFSGGVQINVTPAMKTVEDIGQVPAQQGNLERVATDLAMLTPLRNAARRLTYRLQRLGRERTRTPSRTRTPADTTVAGTQIPLEERQRRDMPRRQAREILGEEGNLYQEFTLGAGKWLGFFRPPTANVKKIGIKVHVDISDLYPDKVELLLRGVTRWLREKQLDHKVLSDPYRGMWGTQAGKIIAIYPEDNQGEPLKADAVRKLCEELDRYIIQELQGARDSRDSSFRLDGKGKDRLFVQEDEHTSSGRVGVRFGGFDTDVIIVDKDSGLKGMVFDDRENAGQNLVSMDLNDQQTRAKLDKLIGSFPLPLLPPCLAAEEAFIRLAQASSNEFNNTPITDQDIRQHFIFEKDFIQGEIRPMSGTREGTSMFVVSTKQAQRPWVVKAAAQHTHLFDAALGWLKEFIITQTMKDVAGSSVVANDPIGFLQACGLHQEATELEQAYTNKDWDKVFEMMLNYFTVHGHVVLTMPLLEKGKVLNKENMNRFWGFKKRKIFNSLENVVQSLHEHGIYHRDLKPSNLWLTDNGEIKIFDFESAVLIDAPGSSVQNGHRHFSQYNQLYTPGYAHPYQDSTTVYRLMDDQQKEAFLSSQDKFAVSVLQDYILQNKVPAAFSWQMFKQSLVPSLTAMDLLALSSRKAPDAENRRALRQFVDGLFDFPENALQAASPAGTPGNVNGGIDLSSSKPFMEVRGSGPRIKFKIDPALLKRLQYATGFIAIITSIQPLKDLRAFLVEAF
ncbi:MAG: serine/threonine protein kinase [Candidatus Omnitrophica bacterium]|nr:serine/threonine protein kinase [Candidatus Omnitrophota bacterium]